MRRELNRIRMTEPVVLDDDRVVHLDSILLSAEAELGMILDVSFAWAGEWHVTATARHETRGSFQAQWKSGLRLSEALNGALDELRDFLRRMDVGAVNTRGELHSCME